MEKLEGEGMAFLHACGHVFEKELVAGEVLKVDTGCIVGFTSTVNYDIQFVGGIKNTLFGGEGLFFATLTGPGKVWIQSLPISNERRDCLWKHRLMHTSSDKNNRKEISSRRFFRVQ